MLFNIEKNWFCTKNVYFSASSSSLAMHLIDLEILCALIAYYTVIIQALLQHIMQSKGKALLSPCCSYCYVMFSQQLPPPTSWNLEHVNDRLSRKWLKLTQVMRKFLFWVLIVKCLRYYLPTPPLWQDMTQGQFLSGV